jgi:hypothetical protein
METVWARPSQDRVRRLYASEPGENGRVTFVIFP